MAHRVVSDVVLDAQVVRAMHRHATAVGVMNRGVLDVLALAAVADQVPVNRIPREGLVLTHAEEFDTGRRPSGYIARKLLDDRKGPLGLAIGQRVGDIDAQRTLAEIPQMLGKKLGMDQQ